MDVLIVDNYDSFTFNLFQLFGEELGRTPTVVPNDVAFADLDLDAYDAVVLSPGPGRPDRPRDFGVCSRIVAESPVPVLGICLGHQGIASSFGGSVVRAPAPMHGRVSHVHHRGDDLFADVPSPFEVVRYHSLAVEDVPAELEVTAWTDDGVPMGLRHRTRPLWGVQFHPESISSSFGAQLVRNFAAMVRAWRGTGQVHDLVAFSPDEGRRWIETRRVDVEPDTEVLYRRLFASAGSSFWLDSSSTDQGRARFSFLGDDRGPLAERVDYDVERGEVRVTGRAGGTVRHEDVFAYLDRTLSERSVAAPPGLPFDFALGYVGWLGYELKADTTGDARHPSPSPDASLLYADRAVVVDHVEGSAHLLCLMTARTAEDGRAWLARTEAEVRAAAEDTVLPPVSAVPPSGDELLELTDLGGRRTGYLADIARCLDKIDEGESYEVCLTTTADVSVPVDPLAVYRHLRRLSPVPYGALLTFGDHRVLSASPEQFLSVDAQGRVQSKPIKGTRPRGRTAEEDRALYEDLRTREKDRAENLMIVDLLRNDLNSVCELGTVGVPVIFDIETYAPVHQMVSTIVGRLRADRSAVDCVRAVFPGGSMTGAPKKRTMEIIDDLEGGPRGVYSGALGWFSHNGAAELSIVIRTLVVDDDRASFGVGGAVVALSDPQDEFDEIVVKSQALLRAVHAAGREHARPAPQDRPAVRSAG